MRSRAEIGRALREEIAAGGDEDAAREAVEEQEREDEAERLLLTARERSRGLTEEERARAARLRGLA